MVHADDIIDQNLVFDPRTLHLSHPKQLPCACGPCALCMAFRTQDRRYRMKVRDRTPLTMSSSVQADDLNRVLNCALEEQLFLPDDPLHVYTSPENLARLAERVDVGCRNVLSFRWEETVDSNWMQDVLERLRTNDNAAIFCVELGEGLKQETLGIEASEKSSGNSTVSLDDAWMFLRTAISELHCILVVDIRIFFSDNLGSHFACVYGAREDPESGSRTLFIADPYVVYTPKEVLTSASEFIEEMEDWTHAGGTYKIDFHRFHASWNSNPDGVNRWCLVIPQSLPKPSVAE